MKIKIGIISLLAVLILALSGCNYTKNNTTTTASQSSSAAISQVSPPQATSATSQLQTTTSITAKADASTSALALESLIESIYPVVNPSVVNIQVIEKPQTTLPSFPGLQITPGQPQTSSALGSGFVWDTEGHIVTNNHVVADTESISVTFYDGTIVKASVVGTDPDSDLAVIKVDVPSTQLHPVQLADSTQLKVGQLAIAIGNPFGLQGTMTVGFISGLGRLLPTDQNTTGPSYSIPDIIQTDASINPGNSGGVLLDDNGSVIGVTSAIATDSGSSAGVGFAIPSAIVGKVVPGLIKDGHYAHPWLGVSVATLTPDINNAMNLKADQRGALVETIIANGPADKAGLQASGKQTTINGTQVNVGGDVIIAMGSQAVKSSDDLVALLSESGSIGQTITLTVLRNGQQIQVPVTLEARPSS